MCVSIYESSFNMRLNDCSCNKMVKLNECREIRTYCFQLERSQHLNLCLQVLIIELIFEQKIAFGEQQFQDRQLYPFEVNIELVGISADSLRFDEFKTRFSIVRCFAPSVTFCLIHVQIDSNACCSFLSDCRSATLFRKKFLSRKKTVAEQNWARAVSSSCFFFVNIERMLSICDVQCTTGILCTIGLVLARCIFVLSKQHKHAGTMEIDLCLVLPCHSTANESRVRSLHFGHISKNLVVYFAWRIELNCICVCMCVCVCELQNLQLNVEIVQCAWCVLCAEIVHIFCNAVQVIQRRCITSFSRCFFSLCFVFICAPNYNL